MLIKSFITSNLILIYSVTSMNIFLSDISRKVHAND